MHALLEAKRSSGVRTTGGMRGIASKELAAAGRLLNLIAEPTTWIGPCFSHGFPCESLKAAVQEALFFILAIVEVPSLSGGTESWVSLAERSRVSAVMVRTADLRAADLGLTARDIGLTVNALMDGALIGGYQHQGEEIDLVLRGEEDWFRTQDIGALPIYTPRGQVVPLNGVARIQVTTGPEQISHKERSRAITIQVIPPETVALETALNDIQTQIIQPLNDSGELRPPYAIRLSGSADDLNRTREALQWNFLLALVITYLLLASLFESFLFPFVIMLSVPPALAGGILGLEVVNMTLAYQPLDILTMLGFVILIGVVVNNAILIVHQTLNVLRETPKLPAKEAIRDAVSSRVRPIFMSVVTSALGMLPLVIFPGAGSELYRGLGSVVIGGLLMSTLFTLFLVPTFLSLAMDIKAWSNRSKIAKA